MVKFGDVILVATGEAKLVGKLEAMLGVKAGWIGFMIEGLVIGLIVPMGLKIGETFCCCGCWKPVKFIVPMFAANWFILGALCFSYLLASKLSTFILILELLQMVLLGCKGEPVVVVKLETELDLGNGKSFGLVTLGMLLNVAAAELLMHGVGCNGSDDGY